MSEERVDRIQKIPSGCPSPARVEKTDSSSSRQSGSPIHWDFETCIVSDSMNRTGRVRPSSWDDSDDELSPKPEMSDSKTCRIYSSESKPFRGSISSELNELKKQFFQSLERENSSSDSLKIENLREKLEMTLICDRRQSPARVRRRSRSSSSSSPVPETKSQNSPETKEKGNAVDELEENDMSPKAWELDSRYYLNNFFTGLRSKRISMMDALPVTDKAEKDVVLMCDNLELEMLNDLNTLEVNEDGGYFCKTSRKLSQILEVEENRKDLEKSSEETMVKPEPFAEDSGKVEEGDSSPLQTARSKNSENVLENLRESGQKKREGYKSLSFEEFGNFLTVSKSSRGSLSERSARIFHRRIDDDFIHLCAKSGKTRLSSPERAGSPGNEKSFQFLCLASNEEFSTEPSPGGKEREKNSNEYLKIDLGKTGASGSSTSRKSTDRSEQNQTGRTKSGKSRSGSNPQSPKFKLSIEGDSARSLRADDVNTPDSPSKENDGKTRFESKMPSEELSGRKSNKSSFRSEGTCEAKTERNLQMGLNSPRVESVKSTPRSLGDEGVRRSGRGTRRSEKKKDETVSMGGNPAFEKNSPLGSSRSFKKVTGSSNRSGSSTRSIKSPKTPEDGSKNYLSNRVTPRSQEIPELELSLQITERPESQKVSRRSITPAESVENNFSPRRSGKSRRSTGRSVKKPFTPRPGDSNSVRSKDSSDRETPRVPFVAVCDALSNQPPVSSPGGRSSWREIDVSSRQPSSRSEKLDRTPENSGIRKTFTPKLNEASEERLFSSRKSSGRSVDSCGKTIISSSFGNASPSRSGRIKSRPSSWTSEERKYADVVPDIEKLDIDAMSGRTTHRSFISEEDEEKDENSSRGSRSGTESDRHSNKRLSIINEASLEDFESSNVSNEAEEKDIWERPRPPSRRDSKRVSPKSTENDKTTPKTSPEAPPGSFRDKPSDGSSPTGQSDPDGGTWTELIKTFEGSANSLFISEKSFPGFSPQKENPERVSMCLSNKETFDDSLRDCTEVRKLYDNDNDNDDDDEDNEKEAFVGLSRKSEAGKIEPPKIEINQILEKARDQQREEDFNFNLVCKDPFVGKMKKEEEKRVGSPHGLYFVDVDRGGHFGMGEFGDVTCWSPGKPDNQDPDKPQDHGDGINAFKSSEVLIPTPEKKEKETKTQRQLWTELKEGFRDFRPPFANDWFPGTGSSPDLNRFIPIGLKISKSDNCISKKTREGSECRSWATYEFPADRNKGGMTGKKLRRNSRDRGASPASKNAMDPFSSGSVDSPKEESGSPEFDYERTPRLSRSLSDVRTDPRVEGCGLNESRDPLNSSTALPFEKFEFSKEEKESMNLNIFLARKMEEETEATSNWLSLKSDGRRKSEKRGKKGKIKLRKSPSPSGEHLIQYLSSRKSRSSVPGLKLRNSNCLQNFYKRFISVFCVTSNSSAATSK